MSALETRLARTRDRICQAAARCHRPAESIALLAVSKTRPASDIAEAQTLGQSRFGESYLNEALEKIEALEELPIEWHFIGRIQSNKTRQIAEHFDWVHSVDQLKQARRLNDQRPDVLPPLNICLQVMIDPEETKSGTSPDQVPALIEQIQSMPRLRLRGLMTLPAPSDSLQEQRRPFRRLRELRDQVATATAPLETLSMGMSADLEAAIAEGSTMVRVGTDIFGPRQPAHNFN